MSLFAMASPEPDAGPAHEPEPAVRPPPSPRLLKVRKLIERCYADPLSPGRMARYAGFTASELRRQFEVCFGTTPEAYLIACRMRAAELLRSQGRAEVDIAMLIGYSSYRRYLGDCQRHERTRRVAAGEAALRGRLGA